MSNRLLGGKSCKNYKSCLFDIVIIDQQHNYEKEIVRVADLKNQFFNKDLAKITSSQKVRMSSEMSMIGQVVGRWGSFPPKYVAIDYQDDINAILKGPAKLLGVNGVGPLHSLDVPPRPWHTIAFDLIGPIHPASTPGNFQYICTAVDYLTRFVVMRIADSETLARFLINHIYFIHGAPSVIICDNASINRSKLIEALTKGLGTTLRFTAPY
ncbi:Gypsy retrotransposon integrase-like protein 1 [Folsomia candida]|uniref:Gypsy retrotransposon integrase-like protein 1 n=1 Tax=Folsomia candida TaxID=158441 RepID=A0A226D6L5_FOLCA|nr:Gypsy retrotransposon integrase-like protein 1 [Folsomia candida]